MQKGFTLIEFIVIISIFAIMAAIALFNFQGFRSNVGLNNLAHDIALTIRQAQVFGWATQSSDMGGVISLDTNGNPLRFAQGVAFGFGNDNPGMFDRSFVLYSKNDPSTGAYVGVPYDTIIDTIAIQGPNHISDIRRSNKLENLKLPASRVIPAGTMQIAQPFAIAFSRPRPEAQFFEGFGQLIDSESDYVGIYISADADCPNTICDHASHVITISRFGEIVVQ